MKRILSALVVILPVVMVFSSIPVRAQTQPSLDVAYNVGLSERYSIFSSITQKATLTISGAIGPHDVPGYLVVTFQFNYFNATGIPPGAPLPLPIVVKQQPLINQLNITIPAGVNDFRVKILGFFDDYSVLYRSTATIQRPAVYLSVAPHVPTAYNLVVPEPPGLQVYSVFPIKGVSYSLSQNLTAVSETVDTGSTKSLIVPFPVQFSKLVILYQSDVRDLFLYVYIGATIAAILVLPLGWTKLRHKLRATGEAQRSSLSLQLESLLARLKALVLWLNFKRLLGLFVLTCILMVGFAAIFGPPPVPRVYLAATPGTASSLGPSITRAGYQYFTPLQAADQFDTMSALGNYNAVVIADYPIPLSSFGLYSSTHVYILTNYLNNSYPDYLNAAKVVYPTQYIALVPNSQVLINDLSSHRLFITTNRFGLEISSGVYNTVVRVEGALTIVATFSAMAFLARFLIERNYKGWLFLAEAATVAFSVFLFTTMVFIQTSVLLGLPVALHAAISPVESATGILGFGGGSRPRELAGVLGFLFGGVVGYGGKSKLDKIGAITFAAIFLYVATDPLTLGKIFYSLVVQLFTSDPGGEVGLTAQETVRGGLGQVMDFFGRYVSLVYYSSHGAVLYYVGALPFALFSMLRKSTATFLLLFSAIFSSIGFIRVADLNALEAIASATPGLTIGVGVMILFLAVGAGETWLRKLLS